MSKVKLIDNKRVVFSDLLKEQLPNYRHISIATGYWDLEGMSELIDELEQYEEIRLLVGQEPLIKPHHAKLLNEDFSFYSDDFPKSEIMLDLEMISKNKKEERLRYTASKIIELVKNDVMKVRILRKPRLHAKAYILGNETSYNAIGIIGSSNFTHAGLNKNAELNYLEDQAPLIVYEPPSEEMPHTHLSWFNELWEDPEVEEWTFEFKEIVENSPVGDLTYGAYDVYIKTLMEVFPDELLPPQELEEDLQDILYAFQNRNAGILINKLNKMGIAILADSVGLGKTITGGAVIKHYIEQEKRNIQIIAPAGLKQQWIDDLSNVLGLEEREGDFNIVSQQDSNAIKRIYDHYDKEWRRSKKIDLFVIDESHNLRSGKGTNYEAILELLKQHKDSHVLLLTATPINNTLLDIANQIQLASKGKLSSVNVPFKRPGTNQIDIIDFFEALNRIQSSLKKSVRENREFDFEEVKMTIHDGLRHYLVRSTRQGVEAEGSLMDKDGVQKSFPTSIVGSIEYEYKKESVDYVIEKVKENIPIIFEEINPLTLNLDLLSSLTQQTSHPLDFLKDLKENKSLLISKFGLDEKTVDEDVDVIVNETENNLIEAILKMIFTLGFTPYRSEVYRHRFYDKTIDELRSFKKTPRIGMQLTIHNILQVTWLKRLESSMYAFNKSVKNYKYRLELFEKYLNLGYIILLSDLEMLENEYNQGSDIEAAFGDYEEYLKEREAALKDGREDEIKKKGIERVKADPKKFNIEQLKIDLQRERLILDLLLEVSSELSKNEHNTKMISLVDKMSELIKNNKYGKKILVFSFFADTIEYLKENMNELLDERIPGFSSKAEFLSGRSREVERVVRRFSPVSKKYQLNEDEIELDYLFSTDILSEGQNLQDSAILINYDLHWNPVRMIQRNGRINRIGSKYDEVYIGNLKPSHDLEMYLKLVNRLEVKISTIKNTIGLDQGILDNKDINPIEFIEKYYQKGELPVEDDDDLLAHVDEHILELRKFLFKNDEERINYVKNIPLGKWNYLPERVDKQNYVISLISAQGVTSSGSEINDIYFIENDPKDKYFVNHINYSTALAYIKTDETDNLRYKDNIKIDRNLLSSRAMMEAIRQADNPKDIFDLKPKMEEALLILQDFVAPGMDLQRIIGNGVQNITDKREIESIFRATNKEVRDTGTPGVSTLKRFIKFIEKIESLQNETRKIEEAKGVLFYANKSKI